MMGLNQGMVYREEEEPSADHALRHQIGKRESKTDNVIDPPTAAANTMGETIGHNHPNPKETDILGEAVTARVINMVGEAGVIQGHL